MNVETILASVIASAIVSAVTSYYVTKTMNSKIHSGSNPNNSQLVALKNRLVGFRSSVTKKLAQTAHDDIDLSGKEKRKGSMPESEFEATPQHSQVLRKVASDMKSQLKTYNDFASRDPQPVKIPELSEMALWNDLVKNHLPSEEESFAEKWADYIVLLKRHAEIEAKMFRGIEDSIKNDLEGLRIQQKENITQAPPENVVYFTSSCIGTIMNTWLNSIRNPNAEDETVTALEITTEDSKKTTKASGQKFLVVDKNKVALGEEEAIDKLEKLLIKLTTNLGDIELFKEYEESVKENETEIAEQKMLLDNVLTNAEDTEIFKGKCPYT